MDINHNNLSITAPTACHSPDGDKLYTDFPTRFNPANLATTAIMPGMGTYIKALSAYVQVSVKTS